MIHITDTIAIDESEIKMTFIHSSGPGGQNVNKVATAVQLRFDAGNSPSLPNGIRKRLVHLAGKRITEDGILIITSQRFRKQERNRQDALDRLCTLIRRAAIKPKPRRRTSPTLASEKHRVEMKRFRSRTKLLRRPISKSDE
jgi:ribosome-associated protein